MRTALRVLIVEDSEDDAMLIVAELSKGGYEVTFEQVETGEAMKNALDKKTWDIIISDHNLPCFNAFRALEVFQESHFDLPFIIISGCIEEDVAVNLMKKGAHDYLLKNALTRLSVAVARELREATIRHERRIAKEELLASYEKVKTIFRETINAMGIAVEKRDKYTDGHQKRVAKFATDIGRELGYTEREVEGLFIAASLHDLGKIIVPRGILNKKGVLSAEEFDLIKEHPGTGYDILKPIEFDYPVALSVLHHHERMDGSGYPSGLTGENIIPGGRILAIADVVEAISNERPYRLALGTDVAIKEIRENKGRLYDPDMVDISIRLIKKNPTGLFERDHN